MARVRQCLGVDIGSHSVRIAELNLKGDSIEVKNLVDQQLELDAGLSEAQRQGEIASTVSALVKDSKIKTKNAVFCVPGQSVFVRQLKVPSTTPERLHRIIHFEAREQIPFPLEQTSLEYQVFETENPNEVEVLLVAMRIDHIKAFMNLVRKTGLKPLAISVSSLALHNFHEVNAGPKDLIERAEKKKPAKKKKAKKGEEEPEEEPTEEFGGMEFEEIQAQVNLGGSMMDLAIPKAGGKRLIGFTRTVPAAGIQIDRAIRQQLSLPTLEQARQIKEQQTAILSSDFEIAGDVNAVNMDASRAATHVVNSLVAEIRRSLDFFISQPDGVAVDGIVLSGGLSGMSFLDNYIEEKMGVPVELASIKTEKLEIAEEDKEKVSNFVIPIGLALQGIEVSQIAIDFLPQDVKNVRAFAENKLQTAVAVLAVLVTLGLGMVTGNKYIQQKETQAQQFEDLLVRTERDTKMLKEAETANKQVADRFAELVKLKTRRDFGLQFALELFTQRPPEILIERLEFRSNGLVFVEGLAPQKISVNQFLEALNSNRDYFTEARIESLSSDPVSDQRFPETKVWKFKLKIITKSRDGRFRSIKGKPQVAQSGGAGGGSPKFSFGGGRFSPGGR